MQLNPEQLHAASAAALVALAQLGDSVAYGELVARNQGWVRGLLLRLSGNAALADDLAQETLLQAWRKIGTLHEAQAFNGWLKKLAVNIWLGHARRRDPLRGAEEIKTEEAARPTANLALDLSAALGALPPTMRLCIVLAYHEGHSHSEVAAITGLPLGTVKSNITRGSAHLKAQLAAYQENTA